MALKKKYVSDIEGGRLLLVGDIHGCCRTLVVLMDKIDLQKNDQIFFVGDYINKGPDSKGVLDFLIALKKEFKNVYFLKGNNESYFYKTLKKSDERILKLARRYQVEDLFKYEGNKLSLRKKYRKFLKSTYNYIETDGFYVVHAGFDFKSEIPFYDTYSMLWMRNFKPNKKRQHHKPVIHGHKITPIKIIRKAVKNQKFDLPIDNGCVLGNKNKNYGRLVCLDYTNNRLIEQENVEV